MNDRNVKMKLVLLLISSLLLVANGSAANQNCGDPTFTAPFCKNSQNATSGTPITINNLIGTRDGVTFEIVITGAPASVSIPIQGCMRGGTCDALETYTGTSNSDESPTIQKVYDYFLITPTFTGGTNPTLTVNTTATTS